MAPKKNKVKPHVRLNMSIGPTINLGNYCSLRASVSISYDQGTLTHKEAVRMLWKQYLTALKMEIEALAEFSPDEAEEALKEQKRLVRKHK